MSLTQLTLGDVKKLEKLLTRKAKLEADIAKINGTLEGFSTDSTRAAKPGKRRGRKPGRKKGAKRGRKPAAATKAGKAGGRRGAVKQKILKALKASGAEGLHVKDLAKKLKTKELNIRAWFATTGKKIAGLEKVAPARYTLKG